MEEQWFCEPSKPLFLSPLPPPPASGKHTEDSENGFLEYPLKTSDAIGFFIGLLVKPFWQNCTKLLVQRYTSSSCLSNCKLTVICRSNTELSAILSLRQQTNRHFVSETANYNCRLSLKQQTFCHFVSQVSN